MNELTSDLIIRAGGTKDLAEICGRVVAAVEDGDVCYRLSERELAVVKDADLMGLFKLHDKKPLLYTMRNWQYEQRVLTCLKTMLGTVQSSIEGLESDARLATLNARQVEAVKAMSTNRIVILTGGPGTGKTYTLARAVMLATERDPNLRLCLAAPTGKAAARMSESIEKELGHGYKATTIHQLLGPNRDFVTFKHNADNPLECDWLIVDEASMVDLPLMAKLMDALPKGCRLTLVGDENQLPSVERGSVFADLCHLKGLPYVHLDESKRFEQGGEIFNLSESVNSQNADRVLKLLSKDTERVAYVRLDAKDAFDPAKWKGFMEQVREKYKAFLQAADVNTALAHLCDFRVLCAFRVGPYGVEALNEYLLKALAGSLRAPKTPVPMMVTRNDHVLGLANGDVGVVMPDEPEYLQLETADKQIRRVRIELIAAREYAFASTIHKSQGSEFDEIAVVIPPVEKIDGPEAADQTILTKEILYTGITRGKSRVSLYSSDDAIAMCCQRGVSRVSGIRDGRGECA